jgi:hypothetical protein
VLEKKILKLRICVSFLGEREQLNWWPSSFLSSIGESFLGPIFPKTSTLARVNGASEAAKLVHDDHIGIGSVYHLFRLPEIVEQNISKFIVKETPKIELLATIESAQAGLQELSAGFTAQGLGPLLIEKDVMSEAMVSHMAAAYERGFRNGEQVYPYYRSEM